MAEAESYADGGGNHILIKFGMAEAESYADGDGNHVQPKSAMAAAEPKLTIDN